MTLSLLHRYRALRRPGRRPGRSLVLRGALVMAVTTLSLPAMSGTANAAANLTITPITWDVVGLDSNKPLIQGPDTFAAGARVCNTGDVAATNLVSNFVWDTANVYINTTGLTTLTAASLAAGACTDFYYNVVITRNNAAYDTTRGYHITVTANGLGVSSTPVPRQIYVEHLVSQNRNAIDSITGPTTVYVGNTYTYVLNSHTAPGGYEQLSSFLNFPNAIFQIVSVNSTYTAPAGGTNSTIYGNACGWDPVPTSGTYRSCIGPNNYAGGKVGGTVATTYVVNIVAGGTSTVSGLINDFSGSSYHYNSDFGVGINSVTITALNQGDVGVSIADAPDPVTAGTDLTYTLTVSNAGPSPATGVQVTDPIPPGTSFVSASNGGTLASGTVTWNIGTIASGASVTRTLVVHVDPSRTTALTDTAAVTTTATDTNNANNSASQGTTVATSADLSIVKTDSPDPVGAGENLTYTLAVANAGPSDANAVVVSDTLPAGSVYVSATPSQGTCSQALGVVTCNLGGMAASGSASVVIVMKPGAAGSISNTATVSSSTSDPSNANNSSTQGTTVQPRVDVSITKSDSVDPVTAGNDLTYTMVVANAGPSSAAGVTVSDPLPAGTSFVSADNGGTLAAGTVTWAIGTLASGASVTRTLVVHVNPSLTAALSNTASVSTSTTDTNAGNNSASQGTTVATSADLSVGISDTPDPVAAGGSITYTVSVPNGGPSDAVGVSLSDTIPPGTSYVSATPSQGTCSQSLGVVTCNLGGIAAGAGASVDVVVTAGGIGTLTDTASVSATTPDPNASNDDATEDTQVTPVTDLAVTLTDGVGSVVAGTSTTYDLTLTNNGPLPVPAGVVVSVPLPPGTAASTSDPDCQVVGALLSCTTPGVVAVSGSVTWQFTLDVDPDYPGASLDVTGSVSSSPYADPNASNDSATDSDAVTTSADLAVSIDDGTAVATAGLSTTYLITLTNNGPSTVPAGATVSSLAPLGTTPSESEADCQILLAITGCTTPSDLAPGGSISWQVTLTVDPDYPGATLDVTAAIGSSAVSDPDASNNQDTDSDAVTTFGDLSITKSSSPDPVVAGTDLTYTIIVTNAGPSSATAVTVDDPIPTGTDFVSADNGGALAAGTVTWNLGTMASGASVTLTLVVHVHASRTSDLSNTATVSSPTADPDVSNDVVTEPTTVSTSADLAVAGSDAPDPLGVGDDLTYALIVTNGGRSDALGVSLVDTLPLGVTFVSAVPSAGTCSELAGVVTCSLGDMANGGSETVTIVVRPTAAGTITDQADVSSSTPDPDGSNDSTSIDTDVQPRVDVSITIADAPDPVTAGTDLTYTVTVTNGGPSTASGVAASVPVPAGTSFVSASPGGVLSSGTVTWNLGAIGSGSNTVLMLVVRVDPDRTADVTSSAAVTTTTVDTDASNDADSATTAVDASADLSVSIVDSPDPVAVGADVTYTVSVSNGGPSDAAGVMLVDTIPAGTVFVSATPTQGSCLQSLGVVTCSLGGVAAGAGADVDIVVTVGGIGSITDQAAVSSSTADPDASNDDASEDTSVTPIVDLAAGLDDGTVSVVAGGSTTYDVTLTNNGPVALPAGAVVTASVPSGTSASESEADCDIAGVTLTCTTSAVLPVGTSVTWQVTLDVDPDYALGTVDLTASVASSPYADVEASNDSATDSDAVTTSADLSVNVDDGVGLVTAGDPTTYSITLTNNGPSTVPAGATIAALAPPGTTPSESGADCQIVLDLLGCSTAVGLAPGDSVTWQLTLTLDPDYGSPTVDLTAAVGLSPVADPDASNDSDTDSDAVTTSADLAVNVDDGTPVITPGSSSTYTVTLSNGGPSTEPAGATVTVPIAAGTTPSESEADCQIAGALLTCTTPASIAPGGSIVWQFTSALDAGFAAATLDVTAAIASTPVPDADASNDSATDTDAVGASADVAVSITDVPDPVGQGQPLTYTLTVSNGGPSGATNVTVVDTLPPSVAFVSATPSQGTCSQAAGVVTCDLGALGSGGAASIVIVVTPGTIGTITDQATVSATQADPDLANNTDSEDSIVEDPTDLSVQIADAPDPVTAGLNVTYTLTVGNAGPSPATGVVVTDTLPAGVVFVSATPSQGSCAQAAGIVTCPLGGVLAGAYATVTIVVTTAGAGVLTDQASVTGSEPDPQPANNADSEATSVNAIGAPSADLSISIADAPDPASVGQDVTYTATIANAGPAGATSVTVTDTLPAGATFVSATPSQGTCSQLAGTVTCSLGAVASGGSATVAIVVRPSLAGTMTDSATVQGAEVDPTPADATDTENTLVNASANLSVTKVATPNPVALGQNLTYTMVVSNAGPSDATGVTLTDPLPAGVTFVSATSTAGTCVLAIGTVTCAIGNLAASASATVTLVVTPTVAGPISNTATVDGNEPDPAAANDAATAAATVTGSADLSLTKTASPDPVIAGKDLTYMLVVTNAGPAAAAGVILTDPLPAGMTFVSADAGGTEASGTVTWAIGAVPSGGSVTLTLVVRPDPSTTGIVMNAATVAATTADQDATDNDASAAVTVDAPTAVTADLSVTKTVDDDAPTAGDLVTYTITVTDEGPADATGVVVKDDLPHGLNFISAKASEGTYDDHSGTWDVGDLALGDVERLEIRAKVASDETIDNVASVAAVDQSDPVEGNDAAVQGLTVVNASDPTDPTDPAVLAFTGSRIGQVTALALVLLLAGLALIVLGRRRDEEQEEPAPSAR